MKKCPKPLGYGIRRTPVVLGLSAALCMPAAFSYANVGGRMDSESVQSVLQTHTVKGTIVDETGEPLIGVSVIVKGQATVGTITDFDGNFVLDIPTGKGMLEVSYIGYKTQTVTIGKNTQITIKMEPDTQALEEVVVIGYGAVKKRDLTGAVSSVKNEDITLTPATNPMQALQGRVAGLDITQASGQPGEGPKLQLRGTRSFTASGDPMFIIDGMPGDYSTLNPNDIESIEVLKDASSTAVYGAAGANGVIIITTKSGKAGKININLNAYVGFNGWATVPEMRSGDSYINVLREANQIAGTYSTDEALFSSPEAYKAHLNGQYIDLSLIHISFYRHMYDPSEGQYESKDLKLPTVNVTIQNTISAKALDTYNHAFGSTLGGENCAFMRNLWASNSGRNPSVGWNGVFNFVNNVVFNWVHRSSDGGDYTAMFNMINNYYKPGPATPKDTPVGHRILKPEAGRSKLDHKVYGRVYADGNIMEGYPAITEDNWAGGIQIETQPNTDGYTENMRSNRPFEMPYIRITSAHDAYDFVLKNAGANIPCRDIVDERIVEEVRTGVPYYDKKMAKDANGDLTGLAPKSMGEDGQFKYRRLPKDSYKQGIITDIRQMGGYPEYKGTPYVDTDGDGMPDEWEKANGLNPNDPSDANKDCTGDGYTNIEKYINGISTRNCIDWSDLRNNYDTLASKGKLM